MEHTISESRHNATWNPCFALRTKSGLGTDKRFSCKKLGHAVGFWRVKFLLCSSYLLSRSCCLLFILGHSLLLTLAPSAFGRLQVCLQQSLKYTIIPLEKCHFCPSHLGVLRVESITRKNSIAQTFGVVFQCVLAEILSLSWEIYARPNNSEMVRGTKS